MTDAVPSSRSAPSYAALLGILGLVVVLLFVFTLAVGQANIPLIKTFLAALKDDPGVAALILVEIRLPRALLAVIVGATLGLAGAALQGLLRNPLADPGVIGVSSSAGLGAVLAIYFGSGGAWGLLVPGSAMVAAAIAVVLLLVLAGREASPLTLILAGVAVNAFAGALTALALNLAPSQYAVIEAVFWLLGSLADRSFDHVYLVVAPCVVGWILLLGTARPLDALTLGGDVTRSLGIDLRRLQVRIVLGAACCVGAAVSVSGAISFVGLVVPHLLRPLVGYAPGRLLAASALGGAALLLAADTATRILPMVHELRLGVVTAIIGAPFFLFLIVNTRRSLT